MADTSTPNLPRTSAAVAEPTLHDPDARGHFGVFGGRYVAEALMAVIEEVTAAYEKARTDQTFLDELDNLQTHYAGRPSPLYEATRLSEHVGGARIFLKREDLNHTGSHKINNVLGQALLARQMGKTRVIAETGAGQHGVATATACALLGLECVIYMGAVDTARQALNVARMRLLGAEVVAVQSGSKTLKDAVNEAFRDWVANADDTYYCFGTAAGPHPFPLMVRDFQRVIGLEARAQMLDQDRSAARRGDRLRRRGIQRDRHLPRLHRRPGRAPDRLRGRRRRCGDRPPRRHILRRDARGVPGVVLLCDAGRRRPNHRIPFHLSRIGLSRASGPSTRSSRRLGRTEYRPITDTEAMNAFRLLCRLEGIIPAIETAHAIAGVGRSGGRTRTGGRSS